MGAFAAMPGLFVGSLFASVVFAIVGAVAGYCLVPCLSATALKRALQRDGQRRLGGECRQSSECAHLSRALLLASANSLVGARGTRRGIRMGLPSSAKGVPLAMMVVGGAVSGVLLLVGIYREMFMLSLIAAIFCWLACCLAISVAVVCDTKKRVIPLECSWVLAGFGLAFQLVFCGWDSAAFGLVFAVLTVFAGVGLNALSRMMGWSVSVGGGDVRCMAALSIATGEGAVAGCMVCFIVAAVVAVAGCARKALRRSSMLPLAPYFCMWLLVGSWGAMSWASLL